MGLTKTIGDGTIFNAGQIRSIRQFLQAVKIDLNVSAQYELFGNYGGANIDSLDLSSINSSSLIWYVQTIVDFGRQDMKNPHLSPEAVEVSKDPALFENKYGSHAITGEDMGCMLTLVFTLNNIDASQMSSINSSMSAAISSPFAGGRFSGNYKTFISSLLENSSIQVSQYSYGGNGKHLAAQIIRNIDDLTNIQNEVSDFLETASPANARPLAYYSTPLSVFVKTMHITNTPTLYDAALPGILFDYLNCNEKLAKINALLSQDDRSLCWVDTNDMNSLNVAQQEYYDLKSKIINESALIKDHAVAPLLPVIHWPKTRIPSVSIKLVPLQFPTEVGFVEGGHFDNISIYSDGKPCPFSPIGIMARFY